VPKQILVVEDDPLVSLMLENYLEALGIEVAGCAEDVAASLHKIATLTIDAALVDIHLANGQTSEAVIAALKAADIPFLVMTGGPFHFAEAMVAEAPVLTKPFTLAQLERELDRI
jgi:DNA-binding response OmpR family regulator